MPTDPQPQQPVAVIRAGVPVWHIPSPAYARPMLAEGTLLYAAPPTDEMSPEFTDSARAALLWVLWHHQGGSSPVGQPLRFALGMGDAERLTDRQIGEAKRWAALTGWTTEKVQKYHPATPTLPVAAAVPEGWKDAYAAFQGAFDAPLARRHDNSEFAQDARRRLREFNDAMLAAAPSAPAAEGTGLDAGRVASAICLDVAELPDRNSPSDWPEAMLVTADELRAIVLRAIAAEKGGA